MLETQTTAAAVRTEPRTWLVGVSQATGDAFGHAAGWAANIAQQLGGLVAALMGPAIVSAYAFAAWSLAANLGWTDTFIFSSGPLSNWFVWLVMAVLVNLVVNFLPGRDRRASTK
jgi:hypothetical protein